MVDVAIQEIQPSPKTLSQPFRVLASAATFGLVVAALAKSADGGRRDPNNSTISSTLCQPFRVLANAATFFPRSGQRSYLLSAFWPAQLRP
jgi:hypothetical protein